MVISNKLLVSNKCDYSIIQLCSMVSKLPLLNFLGWDSDLLVTFTAEDIPFLPCVQPHDLPPAPLKSRPYGTIEILLLLLLLFPVGTSLTFGQYQILLGENIRLCSFRKQLIILA